MQFTFTEDQNLFRDSLRPLLEKQCTPDSIRALWDDERGRSSERWAALASSGLLGVLVPESHGGLGMNELDLVLPLEETGRVALPEPVVETAAVAAPLLAECGNEALAGRWLPAIASGEAVVTVAGELNPAIADAGDADLVLIERGGEIAAVEGAALKAERQPTSDPSRRLYTVEITGDATTVASGDEAQAMMQRAADRAALGIAAQQLGITARLIELAVEYAKDRHQFGKPIGSFQAIKHHLADVAVKLEFARPMVYRAAHSIATDSANRTIDVSQAKAMADEAACAAAKTALQVHGAIGYTWEVDLHLWRKRAWALESSWGSRLYHRRRVADAVLRERGAPSFGFEAAGTAQT